MFFWIGSRSCCVVFVGLVTWGVRGIAGRAHEPGTRHLRLHRATGAASVGSVGRG